MNMSDFTLKPVGGSAVLACFGTEISDDINARVMALAAALAQAEPEGIIETVPSFAALLVRFDPLRTGHAAVEAAVRSAAAGCASAAARTGRLVEIPVCYGGKYGADLPFIASHAGLSEAQVVALHSGRDYRIYMLGFLPGFPYLGGLDERIYTPRLPNPRTKIPAGSVGIGGKQTGIYPIASPGGWQLLGRTPLRLFSPENGGALPYEAGDTIRFVPVSEAEYARIAREQGTEVPE